jgi:hypothetical protein
MLMAPIKNPRHKKYPWQRAVFLVVLRGPRSFLGKEKIPVVTGKSGFRKYQKYRSKYRVILLEIYQTNS